MQLVLITGMSGAGRTIVLRKFEDMGYFCVDNLPPPLLPQFARLCREKGNVSKAACVVDLRSGSFFESLTDAINQLRAEGVNTTILFLDSSDEALTKRFKETRRKHPLFRKRSSIPESIRTERLSLREVRAMADKIIDTSAMLPKDLRSEIAKDFGKDAFSGPIILVRSFGFKHGVPADADLVFDVRLLANPHYVPGLKDLDGRAQEVAEFIHQDPNTSEFLSRLFSLLAFCLPLYVAEGKAYLTIAVGCTGGRHRSVVVAEEIARFLQEQGYHVQVQHRDIGKS